MTHLNEHSILESCGNIFADLDLPDADEMLAKAKLASQIMEIIQNRGMTQEQAAALLGTDQSYISKLKKGSELRRFTLDRLMNWLTKLDCNVVVSVKPKAKKQAVGEIRVAG